MKITHYIALLLILCSSIRAEDIADGEIIFQRSQTRQSVPIAITTNSDYTHVGIIFFDQGPPYVYEAVQHVRMFDSKLLVTVREN